MSVLIFLVFLLTFSIVHAGKGGPLTKPNGDLDSVGVEQHILILEQTVSDLQSRFQVQEQKQAAVLSSVLSKLTSTNSRLFDLEQQHNFTLLKLADANDQLKDLNGLKKEFEALKQDLALGHADLASSVTRQNDMLNSTRKDVLILQTQINSTTAALDLQKSQTEVLQTQIRSTAATHVILQNEGKEVQRNLTALRVDFYKFKDEEQNKVAFSSALSSKTNLTKGEVVRYDYVSLNAGNGYNVTTGTFICPESGIYLFTIHGVKASSGNCNLGIVHNDHIVATAYIPKASNCTRDSNTAIIKLNYQDTVRVKAIRSSRLTSGSASMVNTFGGYLVSSNT